MTLVRKRLVIFKDPSVADTLKCNSSNPDTTGLFRDIHPIDFQDHKKFLNITID